MGIYKRKNTYFRTRKKVRVKKIKEEENRPRRRGDEPREFEKMLVIKLLHVKNIKKRKAGRKMIFL